MNPKISQALALLTGCPASDFAELAILAADQAGLGAAEQSDLRSALIPTCADCDRPADDYTIVSTSGRPNLGPLCEGCHDDRARHAKHQRSRDIEDGRGDHMRDMQRGGL